MKRSVLALVCFALLAARLKVTAGVRDLIQPGVPGGRQRDLISITVTNIGRVPVMVTKLGSAHDGGQQFVPGEYAEEISMDRDGFVEGPIAHLAA